MVLEFGLRHDLPDLLEPLHQRPGGAVAAEEIEEDFGCLIGIGALQAHMAAALRAQVADMPPAGRVNTELGVLRGAQQNIKQLDVRAV